MPENQPIEPLEPMNNNPSGKSRSTQLLDGAIALMRISEDWPQFRQFLKKAYPKHEKLPLAFTVTLAEKK
jgi:hypothetical protein